MNSTPHGKAATSKRELLWVGLALAVFGILAVRPSIRGNDGLGHYAYLASLFSDGDFAFSDDYAEFDRLHAYPYKFAELPADPATGRASNRYGVGAALLWSPFVAVGELAARVGRGADAPALTYPHRGHVWGVGLGTLFWGSLGLWLLYGRLRRDFSLGACLATLLGLILATPLGFYLYAHGSMAHGVNFFAMVLLLLAWERALDVQSGGAWLLFGAAGGLLLLTRAQDATWALAFGLCAVMALRQSRLHSTPLLLIGAAALGGLLAFAPQLAMWRYLSGTALSGPTPYLNSYAGSFGWPVHTLAALFSTRHGALLWHPWLGLGLIGLVLLVLCSWAGTPLRRLAGLGLVGFALQAVLIGSWSMWWAGASFGNRFFISALPLLAFGAAELFDAARRRGRGWHGAAWALLVLLILWNGGLLIQYATGMISREEAVPLGQMLRNSVIEIPRVVLARLAP